MREQTTTVLTDAHARVVRFLIGRGIGLMFEVPMPPYTADVYLTDYHAVLEIDGPQHSKKADNRRDAAIYDRYGALTFRIKASEARQPHKWAKALYEFLDKTAETVDSRWELNKLKLPCL